MILGMKKGSATTNQSKSRTTNNRLMLFPSKYHGRQKMSMEKCSVCGDEGGLIGSICECCLVSNREPAEKLVRILVAPMEG